MPRVLFICTAFPPSVGGGSVRNLLVARGLAERGWDVTLLTRRRPSGAWTDATPLERLPDRLRVHDVAAPDVAAIGRRTSPAAAGGSGGGGGALRAGLRSFALTYVLVPDSDAPWIPFAARAALSHLDREPHDAMLTAGPPHSSHVVGTIVRSRRRIRWVLDTQDPWADHPFPQSASRARHAVDRWLEARAFGHADVIVSATDAQTRRFRASYPGRDARFVTLPNGYDESELAGAAAAASPERTVVHLGSFYGARSPESFLRALRSLARARPELVRGTRVVLAGYADGPSAALIREALADPDAGPHLRYHPVLPRSEALALMLGAYALLLVTDPLGGGRDLIPIKAFEYLRAGRPILALVPEGETAALLRRTGGALFAPPDDPAAIEEALARILTAPPAPPDASAVAALEIGHTIDGLASLLRGS